MEYLVSNFTTVKKIYIDKVPAYVITPKTDEKKYKTIIFYHGWSSCAKNQIFRASIFANYGYQVILPEAQYHGERGSLDYDDLDITKRYLLEVIMHNIEEFPSIFEYVVKELNADEKNIIVAGHSMGAMTAGGLFTFKKSLKAGLIFNGCMDWKALVNELIKDEDEISYERMRINDFMLQMNPMIHLEDIKDRALLLFNGENDDVVNPLPQENFYKKAVCEYENKEIICFEKFEKTYHQLTTQMLEEAIIFLKEKVEVID